MLGPRLAAETRPERRAGVEGRAHVERVGDEGLLELLCRLEHPGQLSRAQGGQVRIPIVSAEFPTDMQVRSPSKVDPARPFAEALTSISVTFAAITTGTPKRQQ